jgi:hypothetical protein
MTQDLIEENNYSK